MKVCEGCGARIEGNKCYYCGWDNKESPTRPRHWSREGVQEMISEGLEYIPNSFTSFSDWKMIQEMGFTAESFKLKEGEEIISYNDFNVKEPYVSPLFPIIGLGLMIIIPIISLSIYYIWFK